MEQRPSTVTAQPSRQHAASIDRSWCAQLRAVYRSQFQTRRSNGTGQLSHIDARVEESRSMEQQCSTIIYRYISARRRSGASACTTINRMCNGTRQQVAADGGPQAISCLNPIATRYIVTLHTLAAHAPQGTYIKHISQHINQSCFDGSTPSLNEVNTLA